MVAAIAAAAMKDGVYPGQFAGAPLFRIVWQGKELAIYWGTKTDAERHLWLLRHPGALDEIMRMEPRLGQTTVLLAEVWNTRGCRDIRARYEKGKANG